MNPLAPIISLIKENKVFFGILGLNIIVSSGLLYFTQKAEITEYREEIYEDLGNDHLPIDSLQTGNENKIWSCISSALERSSELASFFKKLGIGHNSGIHFTHTSKWIKNPFPKLFRLQLIITIQKK